MGYLRPNQVAEIENEKQVLERTLISRDVQDRANLQSHIRRIDKELSEKAPPDVSGEDRDRMVRECKEIEDRLVPHMPSGEAMRRNPPGTVGRHMRFEKLAKSRKYFEEGDLARWKDNQLTLNKGDEDPDIANFERLRPIHDHASMLGAQIPGTQYFGTNPSQAYLDGYDKTFGSNEDQGLGLGETDEVLDLSDADTVSDDGEVVGGVIKNPIRRGRKKSTRKKVARKKSVRKKGR